MSRVAKRYAKALFALASEEKLLDKTEADINLLAQVQKSDEQLAVFLSNPLINEKEKLSALQSGLDGKVQPMTLNFLALLAEKRRIAHLPDVVSEFQEMMLRHSNKVEGELVSAAKLTTDQVQKIREKVESMTGKSVLLSEKTDSSLLGGFVVRVEDWVVDNSIRYQLTKLREKLVAR